MDPLITTLASTAVGALIPYLTKAGESLAEKAGEGVFEFLKKRLAGSSAEPVLNKLEKTPRDLDRQAALRTELRDLLAADPAFARALGELLPKVQPGTTLNFNNQFSGPVDEVVQAHTVNIDKRR